MKIRLPYVMACAAIASFLVVPSAHANDDEEKAKPAPTQSQSSQQNKMKTCNVEAGKKALKGDERRAFMSACLKG